MKNLKSKVINRYHKLEEQWKEFPVGKQRKWVICFFAGYLTLTAIVVITVWHDAKMEAAEKAVLTGHIHNPIVEKDGKSKDTLTNKNQDYERR